METQTEQETIVGRKRDWKEETGRESGRESGRKSGRKDAGRKDAGRKKAGPEGCFGEVLLDYPDRSLNTVSHESRVLIRGLFY